MPFCFPSSATFNGWLFSISSSNKCSRKLYLSLIGFENCPICVLLFQNEITTGTESVLWISAMLKQINIQASFLSYQIPNYLVTQISSVKRRFLSSILLVQSIAVQNGFIFLFFFPSYQKLFVYQMKLLNVNLFTKLGKIERSVPGSLSFCRKQHSVEIVLISTNQTGRVDIFFTGTAVSSLSVDFWDESSANAGIWAE